MVAILSQDRRNIVNAETVERIYVDGCTINAQTLCGDVITLGIYEKTEVLAKVMIYISFRLATAKETEKMVVIPSEDTVVNDKEIVAKYIKSMQAHKAGPGVVGVELAPELKKILDDKKKGGDKK